MYRIPIYPFPTGGRLQLQVHFNAFPTSVESKYGGGVCVCGGG